MCSSDLAAGLAVRGRRVQLLPAAGEPAIFPAGWGRRWRVQVQVWVELRGMPDAVLISKWAWCSRRGLVSVSVKLHQELCAFSCVGALQQGVSGRVDVAERFDHGPRIAPLPPPLPSPSHPALVSSSLVNRRTTLRRQSSRLRAPSSAPPPRVCPAPVQAQDVDRKSVV